MMRRTLLAALFGALAIGAGVAQQQPPQNTWPDPSFAWSKRTSGDGKEQEHPLFDQIYSGGQPSGEFIIFGDCLLTYYPGTSVTANEMRFVAGSGGIFPDAEQVVPGSADFAGLVLGQRGMVTGVKYYLGGSSRSIDPPVTNPKTGQQVNVWFRTRITAPDGSSQFFRVGIKTTTVAQFD